MSDFEKTFTVQGMTCASCTGAVEKALLSVEGVEEASVNLASGKVRVVLRTEVADSVLGEALTRIGYVPVFGSAPDPVKQERAERREVLWSALLTLPLMHFFSLPFALQGALALIVQARFGRSFYIGAFRGLQSRTGNMDLLIAVGTSAAFVLSFLSHHPYFESAAMILTLVKLGKWLELRAKRKTSSSLRALEDLRPVTARVLLGGQEFEMPVSGIKAGDQIRILPGERVPLDGTILEGQSELDESFLTGESALRFRGEGERVLGGSINTLGALTVRVSNLAGDTVLSRVIRLIEEASAKKPPIQRLVDRVSGVFVPVVFAIALVAFAWHAIQVGAVTEEAWIRAIAVLVIACPCALGLATPTALMVGTGLAARWGILIRDAEALERGEMLTVLALDKTGTLTEGKPVLVSIEGADPDEALRIAAALQAGSEHPLARAVLRHSKELGIRIEPAKSTRAIPGIGIQGLVNGVEYSLGSARLLKFRSMLDSPNSHESGTVSYLIHLAENRIFAKFLFQDRIKPEAPEFLKELHKTGIRPVLLSGDHEDVVRALAEYLGIKEFRGGLLPEEKAAFLSELKARGEVVGMLGDGINDGPALAVADVGITFSTGTDLAMQTAGITLMGGDPMRALDAIQISTRTRAKIRQNLVWAFLYNVVCIPLAATGNLSPVMAGAAMAFSSVSVVTNSLLLGRFHPRA